MSFSLSAQERLLLLQCAREAIAARLEHRSPHFPPSPPHLTTPCGAFVTLKSGKELRGCIGHVTARLPLVETIKDVAVASAFDDPRFPPLALDEWPGVRIEISVLSPFERVTDPSLITVGVHGVMVSCANKSGLLLPQVATEQGWDREMFLAHTCRKAGLSPETWRSPQARIEVFTAAVFHESQE